jgi:tetratricopeptide (TPR) repeat protein
VVARVGYENFSERLIDGARRQVAAITPVFQHRPSNDVPPALPTVCVRMTDWYTPLAISAILTRSQPAAPLYDRMAATGPAGASRAATGLADLAMYEGCYADAVRMLPATIAKDEMRRDLTGVATKSIVLAEASLAMGAKARAAAAARQGVGTDRGESVVFAAARVLIGAGETAAAERLADELHQRTEGYSRVYADILKADLALTRRAPADAVDALRAAQGAADLWLVNFQLGVAYVAARRFPEAIASFDRCVQRRGEATAVFLDDIPSVRYLATLPYWHARAQEGLGLSSRPRRTTASSLPVAPQRTIRSPGTHVPVSRNSGRNNLKQSASGGVDDRPSRRVTSSADVTGTPRVSST